MTQGEGEGIQVVAEMVRGGLRFWAGSKYWRLGRTRSSGGTGRRGEVELKTPKQQGRRKSGKAWGGVGTQGKALSSERGVYSSQDCTNCASRCSPAATRVRLKWVQVQPVAAVTLRTVFNR